jgi:hypothetical protein
VYESFVGDGVARTGIVPMPASKEKVLGGHAVLAVGYDDSSQRFTVRNSWGPGWGMGGYCTMPYAYLTDSNLADDFWTIRTVATTATEVEVEKRAAAADGRSVAFGPPHTSSPETSQVQFSVHYPRSVAPKIWSTLLTYAHLPEALETIQAQTELRVGPQGASSYLNARGLATGDISRGAEITVVPHLPGCDVNPPRAKFLWLEDWHCTEFRFRSVSGNQAGDSVAGRISFYVGPLLVCDITTFIQFSAQGEGLLRESRTTATSDPYQAIFVSYSHQDSEIVEQLEKAYVVLGIQYLRDVRILRSGEKWNSALCAKIEQADLFQLCWSDAAKRSQYVTQEWKYALGLNRQAFLRPMYWQTPMPEPPSALADIHFAFLDLAI